MYYQETQPGIPATSSFICVTDLSENNMRKQFVEKIPQISKCCVKKWVDPEFHCLNYTAEKEMAPSAAKHPSTEEFASSEDVTPNRISFLEVANSLTGNPVSGNWHVNLLSFFTF